MRLFSPYLTPALFCLAAFGVLQWAGGQVTGGAGWTSWAAALLALGLVGALAPAWAALVRRLGGGAEAGQEARISRTLNEFSRALDLIADVEPLVDEELGKLRQAVAADRLVLLLAEEEEGPFAVFGQRGFDRGLPSGLNFGRSARLVKWLVVNECPLALPAQPDVVEYLGPAAQQCLEELGIGLVVPLTAMNRLVGLLLMDREGGFGPADLDFVARLSPRLGLALHNALLLRQGRLRLRRLVRAERLATVGQLAAGTAHEIRNPLTSIRSTIQYLRRDFAGQDEKRQLVDELLAEVDRINQIIAGLLSFARPSDPSLESLDLAGLLRQIAVLVETTARKSKVAVLLDLPDRSSRIDGDPAQLKQVFLNLFLNAIQAMPGGGQLKVSMRPAGSGYWVEVADTGCGISPENLERVFDPFFTTKEEGTGLGLAICYGIVARHGGQIDLESQVGAGTRVKVKL